MNKRLFSLLLTFVLLVTMAMPGAAAKKEEKEPVSISTAEAFLEFAEQCRLDSYSVDLTVTLDADIDLKQAAFTPIPTFSGVFEGNGHTISGLQVTGEGSVQGLFRYLTATAVVQNLTVQGVVQPIGSQSRVGGIAGSNAGQILNCRFEGTVSGGDAVGGIVGVNEVTGIVEQTEGKGIVYGNHFVGGIAGENHGVLRETVNHASVNTTVQENNVELGDITVQSLMSSESSGTVTDIGGVAGTSNGVIRSCRNYGDVGYPRIGYNIGGIAGTQSGYVAECENFGNIQGRKEVGGIVGQLEPMSKIEYSRDALQILQGQLNTLSGLTNQASNNAQSGAAAITGQIGQLQEQTQTAKDAVEVLLPGGGEDEDTILAAQNALTDVITSMPQTVNGIGSAAQDTASNLSRDMQAITKQVQVMGGTLGAAASAVSGSFTDVSDGDTEKDLGGKVADCVNHGEVLADRSAGGIAGAMALENDLDIAEDWQTEGSSSMNLNGELRAVVLRCENRGVVTVSKLNAGGIVGWQYLGLVKDSINLGDVEAAGADFVGGISGQSSGFIRSSSARCSLTGALALGGIAGSGTIVSDCRSMVELNGAKEQVGAVLGTWQASETDEKQPLRDNYYLIVDTDPGAVDGISYAGQAEPKGMEEFLALDALAEPFRTVTLRFVYESGGVKELEVPAGGSLARQDVPSIPAKEGYVAQWQGLSEADLSEILFDMEFHVQYIGENTVIAGDVTRENGLPMLLAQGTFTSEAALTAKEAVEGPAGDTTHVLREVWTVHATEAEQVSGLRWLLPADMDGEHTKVMVKNAEGWREVTHRTEGSYVVFAFGSGDTAIALIETPTLLYVGIVAALGLVLVLWQYKDKLKRKK